MIVRALLLLLILFPTATAAARERIGIYEGWGAYRDEPGSDPAARSSARCFAIARPERSVKRRGASPFLSVASWPSLRRSREVHVRLSAPRGPRAPLLLDVAGRQFRLAGEGADGWATGAAMDRAIVAAIRMGTTLTVRSSGRDGRSIVEVYELKGAASAIDAATIACAGRQR